MANNAANGSGDIPAKVCIKGLSTRQELESSREINTIVEK
jgi:hypothetical protein